MPQEIINDIPMPAQILECYGTPLYLVWKHIREEKRRKK